MGKNGTKGYTIRINETLLHKLHIVSAYEGRSANAQIVILIRDAVDAFEAKHGGINLEGKRTPNLARAPAGKREEARRKTAGSQTAVASGLEMRSCRGGPRFPSFFQRPGTSDRRADPQVRPRAPGLLIESNLRRGRPIFISLLDFLLTLGA